MPVENPTIEGSRVGSIGRAVDSSLPRFTLDGGPELEGHLSELCAQAREAVEEVVPKSKLDGMLLGGGYGRGEGGVLQTPAGERPYNDLEFYIFLKGASLLSERTFQPLLHDSAHRVTEQAGLEIEFRAASLRKLRRKSVNMFSYDLIMGHRWTVGDEHLLAGCEHHRRADQIPMSEATHLLMNRCSGLLFARQRLEQHAFSREDADFVARNIAKAKLALGDVVLTALGQYHWSCRERNRLLRVVEMQAPWLAEVQSLHTEGVEFKLHPHESHGSRVSFRESFEPVSALAQQLWLWIESRRLEATFLNARDYALSPMNKWPATSIWKNALMNLRAFGPRAASRKIFRYPRERLLNSLPLLLWDVGITTSGAPDGGLLRFLQRELLADQSTLESLLPAYRSLWRHCN